MEDAEELRQGLRAAEARILGALVKWWQDPKHAASDPVPDGTLSNLRNRNEYREQLIALGEPDPNEALVLK